MTRDAAEHLVLCPLAIERRAVRLALNRRGLLAVPVVQTGVGKLAVVEALRRRLDAGFRGVAILAGAAGGLVDSIDDVPRVDRIVDEHGNTWSVPHPGGGTGRPAVTLVAVDRIISTPEDKRSLAKRSGAALVDMESHAFARECEDAGVGWSVVRGVSDGPDETLPSEALTWIDPLGNARNLRAALALALRPSLIGPIRRVIARANRVLPAVGEAVADLVLSGAAPGGKHGPAAGSPAGAS